MRWLVLLLLAAPLAQAASVAETQVVPGRSSDSSPFYELNLGNLKPGEQVDYSWGLRSAGSLTFDIHWHDGAKVVMIVDKEQGTAKSGRFSVPATSNVSFLWENRGNADVTLAYEVHSVVEEGRTLPFPLAAIPLAAAAFALRRRTRA